MRLGSAAALCIMFAFPAQSLGRPAAANIAAAVGTEQFLKIAAREVVIDNPSIATAELLPSKELLISTKAPGRALIYVVGEGVVNALRLRVHAPGDRPPARNATEDQKRAAKKSCPSYKEEPGPRGPDLSVDVVPGTCRAALLSLFDADDLLTPHVEVLHTPESLREQLDAILSAIRKLGLDKSVTAAYLGITLRLRGKVTAAQRLSLLSLFYDHSVGKSLFEDELEIVPDAGAPPNGPAKEKP